MLEQENSWKEKGGKELGAKGGDKVTENKQERMRETTTTQPQ